MDIPDAISTQLPLATLFAIFAFLLLRVFMNFIRDQRAEFLEALRDITEKFGVDLQKHDDEVKKKLDNIEDKIDSRQPRRRGLS